MRRTILAWALAGVVGAAALASPNADAAKQPPREFFSVGPQAAIGPSDIARMGVGGIGRLRLNLSWAQADTAAPAGDFTWRTFDGVVGEAARNGISIFPVLYGTPTWVAGIDGRTGCFPGCQSYLPRSDEAVDAFQAFVEGAVLRYGPGGTFWAQYPDIPEMPIRDWQVWNEQNSGQYTLPQPSVRSYSKLLGAATKGVKRLDPGGKVVLGGMFHDPVSSTVKGTPATAYLRKLYRRPNIASRFDGIAAHPYSADFSKVRKQVADLRRIARQAGDAGSSTWITEIGWASGGIAHPLNKGLQGQARFLRRAFKLFIRNRARWNVRVVSWFSWRDSTDPPICKWCPESGLFDSALGLQPKPSWAAFTKLSGGS